MKRESDVLIRRISQAALPFTPAEAEAAASGAGARDAARAAARPARERTPPRTKRRQGSCQRLSRRRGGRTAKEGTDAAQSLTAPLPLKLFFLAGRPASLHDAGGAGRFTATLSWSDPRIPHPHPRRGAGDSA
eukprot:gene7117-19202_t